MGLADIDVVELHDCYTFTVLLTLEDHGFCEKGESGESVASGALGPGVSLKVNTARPGTTRRDRPVAGRRAADHPLRVRSRR